MESTDARRSLLCWRRLSWDELGRKRFPGDVWEDWGEKRDEFPHHVDTYLDIVIVTESVVSTH